MMAIDDIWYIHDIVYSYTVNDVNGFYKAIIVTAGGTLEVSQKNHAF